MISQLTLSVCRRPAFRVIVALSLVASPAVAFGEARKFEVQSTRDVSGGRSFGSAGPYQMVTGRLYFDVDPALPANRAVVDLGYARKNSNGRVEFSADVVIYRPRDPSKGNGLAIIDVVNRGNKTVIGSFNLFSCRSAAWPGSIPACGVERAATGQSDGLLVGRAGIRLPDVAVPLATVTGWNFRKPAIGAPDQLFPLLGSYIPFAVTSAQAPANGDPRRIDRGAIPGTRRLSAAGPRRGERARRRPVPACG